MTIIVALIVTLVLTVLGGLAILLIRRRKRQRGEDVTTNYRALFIIGVVCAVVAPG